MARRLAAGAPPRVPAIKRIVLGLPGEAARSFPYKQNPLYYKNREQLNKGARSK